MLDLEFIVSFKLHFTVNVSEGTRVCPMVARLNPEWQCKEWDEQRTETYNFFGFDPEKATEEDISNYRIDLDRSGESFTRVRGSHTGEYITKLDLVTNFGKEYIIGHDSEHDFDLQIPYGTRVVCFLGSFADKLLSLGAYYD